MQDKEVSIVWVDLSYRIKQFFWSKEKIILNRLNGSAHFGEILALMGPSGAGKTTLLKCLNGKLSSGLDSLSKIYINSNVKINSCFVGQHAKEHLIMCLTVKQNMIYASKLKNSGQRENSTTINHKINARNIMSELLIDEIEDTSVEDCSGGEQKRISIAVEMTQLVKPNILLIDEPTTGLDIIAAEMVMRCLRRLSESHKMSIITSIHQPNQEIVSMFDSLYVLSKTGNCLFSGPPDQMKVYFSESKIVMNDDQIPIEQLLRLSSVETKDENIESLIQKTRAMLRHKVVIDCEKQMKLTDSGLESHKKRFNFLDVWYISGRTVCQQYIRQWKSLMFQFLWYTLFAIFSTKVFNENIGQPNGCMAVPTNNTCMMQIEDDFLILQNLNFMYFMNLLVLYVLLSQSTLSYLNDLKIFVSEHQNRWYSTGSYFWAKSVVELIPTLIFAIIYATIVFKLSGQYSEGHRYLQFVVILVMAFLCTEGIGHTIGILLLDYHHLAVILSLGLFTSLSLFANFFIRIADMPLLFQYMSETSFFKPLFNSILLIIYGQNRCPPEHSYVLYKYNINDNQLNSNYIKLGLITLFLRTIPFVLLILKNNFQLNFKLFGKQSEKCEESVEMNSNQSVLIDFNKSEKRLSLILKEIQSLSANEYKVVMNNGDNHQFGEQQICVAWTQLTLIKPKSFLSKEKVILKEINGFFEFSTINAIMGCSGAGKTTLLKSINGLYDQCLSDETTILLNKNRKIKTCFITQDVQDHILIGLTAGEAMVYASKLKNPDPQFDHDKNTDKLMKIFLIDNIFHTNVQDCSNGEQKRLVIAMELTSNIKPNMLSIDEPTSGLDSNAAEVVIKCLKNLSDNHNICVITSIHQPNNEILMLFDKLYVLSKYGRSIFSGRPQQLSKYLLECCIECNKNQLPIEVLLKQSCNERKDKYIMKMIEKTGKNECSVIDSQIGLQIRPFSDGIQTISKRLYLRDVWLLFLRSLTSTYRYYWKLIVVQFSVYIFSALSMKQFFNEDIGKPSFCYNFDDGLPESCAKTPEKVAENVLLGYNISYNFFILTNLMFLSISVSTVSLSSDLKLFLNEQRNGWYSTGAYYWSKTIVDFIPTIVTLICYSYVVDIYSKEQSMFYGYCVYLTLGGLLAQSLGQFIGILLASNQRLAVFVSIGVMTIFLLFSGFIIPNKELHYSLLMLSRLFPFKMVIECILLLQYGFNRCSKREFSLLKFMFDLKDDDFYRNTQILIIELILLRFVSLLTLLIKVNSFVKNNKQLEQQIDSKKQSVANYKHDQLEKLIF